MVVGVQDNGDGTVEPDKLNFSPGSAVDPGLRPEPDRPPDIFIVKGNYRVTDAG
jgi:hypothetical protein